MKRYLLILTMLLIALSSPAKDWYVVNSATNVLTSPSIESKVIGSVSPNDTLEVYESASGWSKILIGKSLGYVKSDALEYIGPAKSNINSEDESNSLASEIFFLTWLMTGIALFVFAIMRFKNEHLAGLAHYIRWGIFIFISLMELITIPSLGWGIFDMLDGKAAFFMLVVFLLPITITACLQVITYHNIIEDVKHDCKVSFSFLWAPIALVVGFTLTLITSLWDNQIITISLLAITALSQIYFIVNLVVKITKSRNIIVALLVLATYIIGILAIAPLSAFALFGFLMIKLCKHFFGAAMTPPPSNQYNY